MISLKERNVSRRLKTTLYKHQFEAMPKDLSPAIESSLLAHRLGPDYHVGSTAYLNLHTDYNHYRPFHLMQGTEVLISTRTWSQLRDHILDLLDIETIPTGRSKP